MIIWPQIIKLRASKNPFWKLLHSIALTHDVLSILGSMVRGDGRLLTLEALFLKEIAPVLNRKDEYRSRTLTLKF